MRKDCARLLKENRDAIVQKEEIFDYLRQSHISAKNTARLKRLAASSNREITELAAIVIKIANFKPYKRRRLKVLARQRRDLLNALERTGLIAAHHR